jgi:putative tryptophan/tyrosine transport system substrate-binding protein
MLFDQLRRRAFITLLGSAAAWPLAARAQPAMPVIGFIDPGSAVASAHFANAFRRGLNETGYSEGRNVAIEYHWLEGRYDRLPALAAELVDRRVAVIAAPASIPAALAVKAATAAIPIVFGVGEDPVKLGLVASLARPGGNATGINQVIGEVTAKRLGLLHELVPTANRVGVLVNPADVLTETTLRDVQPAARAIGLQIQVVNASTSGEKTRLSRPLCASRSTPSSSVPEDSSPAGASTLPTRRCAMEFRRPIPSVSIPRSAG